MSKIVDFGNKPSTTISLKDLSIFLNKLGLCIILEGDWVTVKTDDDRIMANNGNSPILVSFVFESENLVLETLININNKANQYYLDSSHKFKRFYTLAHRQILDDILAMAIQKQENEQYNR